MTHTERSPVEVEIEVELSISHDIRNALTAVRLLVEAVRDGVLIATPESGVADQMMMHVRLLESLLDARSAGDERRHGSTIARTVDIAAFVGDWTAAMRQRARQREVDLRLEMEDDLPPVPCRPEQISRVLLNLIGNAIFRTPPGGTARVRVIAHPGGVQIQVDDSGPRLERSVRAALDRAPAASPDPSAGLGIAIARRIVQAHGGRLWAASPARGASLRFSLPAAPPALRAKPAPGPAPTGHVPVPEAGT